MECRTCKYWNIEGNNFYIDTKHVGVGWCERVPLLYNNMEWKKNGDDIGNVLKESDITAFAQDASDYQAELYTKPEHYCSMYVDKN